MGDTVVSELQRSPAPLEKKEKRDWELKISVVGDNTAILLKLSSALKVQALVD